MAGVLGSEVHKTFGWLFDKRFPEDAAKRVRGKLGLRFLFLGDSIADHACLTGETFTIADAYLYAMLRWCERVGIDLALYPNLEEFRDRVAARPSVIASLAAEGLQPKQAFLRSAS